MNLYVEDKVRELERELRQRRPDPALLAELLPRRQTLFGALAAAAGRTLRRTGEGLEAWAARQPERGDHRYGAARR